MKIQSFMSDIPEDRWERAFKQAESEPEDNDENKSEWKKIQSPTTSTQKAK